MGSNHRYSGIVGFVELLNNHDKAFAYVVDEPSVALLLTMSKDVRDVDLLEESLGEYFFFYIKTIFL